MSQAKSQQAKKSRPKRRCGSIEGTTKGSKQMWLPLPPQEEKKSQNQSPSRVRSEKDAAECRSAIREFQSARDRYWSPTHRPNPATLRRYRRALQRVLQSYRRLLHIHALTALEEQLGILPHPVDSSATAGTADSPFVVQMSAVVRDQHPTTPGIADTPRSESPVADH